MSGLIATEVAPHLLVGPHPTRMVRSADADVLALCAAEHQPDDREIASSKVRVLRVRLKDEDRPMPPIGELSAALGVAATIAKVLDSGATVLCVCHAGKNRSAFIAGLALMNLEPMSGDDVVTRMRAKLGDDALSDSALVGVLMRYVVTIRERAEQGKDRLVEMSGPILRQREPIDWKAEIERRGARATSRRSS